MNPAVLYLLYAPSLMGKLAPYLLDAVKISCLSDALGGKGSNTKAHITCII